VRDSAVKKPKVPKKWARSRAEIIRTTTSVIGILLQLLIVAKIFGLI
jgi:hypothetical protein